MGDVGSNSGCLGACWSYVATSLAAKSAKMSQDGAQEPQDEPRWRPRAPKRPPNAAKMAILARFWELLGSIFDDLGGFLAVRLNIKKLSKT